MEKFYGRLFILIIIEATQETGTDKLEIVFFGKDTQKKQILSVYPLYSFDKQLKS